MDVGTIVFIVALVVGFVVCALIAPFEIHEIDEVTGVLRPRNRKR